MEQKTGKMPEKKYRAGLITATIWKNEYNDKEDNTRVFYTVDIVRNYTKKEDKETKWYKTNSYNQKDLADVLLVTRKANEYIRLKVE